MVKATIYDYARMCREYDTLDCCHCPLYHDNNGLGQDCGDFVRAFTDKANEIILKWCEEHPVETRQEKLLKMFPNARVDENGLLSMCPKNVEKNYVCLTMPKTCDECLDNYWSTEVEK